jgi:hypothetical protein
MIARAAGAMLVLLGGCRDLGPAEGERRLVPAVIDFWYDGTRDVLAAPDTVTVNTPFTVSVTSFGGGCESNGYVEVAASAMRAVLTAYDYTVSSRNVACTDILRLMKKTASITFTQSGNATIEVRGKRVGPETTGEGSDRVLFRLVFVKAL